ncbi:MULTISPECIES: YeeE/YedE family protein [unclassified Cupriavidus]|uniref:YeeE/YedE family protein n=1 Tax=unclassified Cupriavidus TaxID=2640874 RepID=UPI001C00092F|nr:MULTISPECIES: YeeE/YedE family protein [unclassified Cupriavidus]MCA3194104.1 YeeE/YedE family protein [Cupriavidus sp.]MCA3199255.1 YeeE/YedE family protein [Cupriavidus sp.]MCA3209681.1 YeeE/YedE family protein [Cupriavidus sp.]MCA3233211.1 YeeE/YedE family protein [Cupriavidus sp.]QWE97128.1 YeeE/YedE family protein [Cupriavidus sp. EM10]
MGVITAWVAGLVFGLGLMVSGMANPAKVLGFLDLAGVWDPSLAFVMIGAISLAALGFLVARRRARSWLGLQMQWPSSTSITWRLILGSATFGIGWGLVGFCPGPALVALGAGYPKAAGFVLAMLAGMMVFELIEQAKSRVARA